jgi:single-stranded-DNA-specific exonuclease
MARQARWLLPNLDPGEVETLSRALRIGMPAASVLCGRGFRDAASARRFLCPSLDDLHDPLAMRGMACAVERLTRAIRNRENILIYGDYDVDGATSVVILKRSIELAGGVADFHVPDRLKDGYGMRPEVVAAAAERGVSLIISVDTGIRAAEVVRRARELSIDVIITDHHLPEAELPPALAVLNPNRPDCDYPEKNLCGVGVAFKLVQALVATLDWPPQKRRRILESLLKLVAIGTVADVAPLTGENRIIVKHGLSGLRDVRNPGLRALLDVAGFTGGSVPTATQVAFRIAPRMNAAGRMATANDVIEMLLTADAVRARLLAEQLHALNTERQKTETDIVETILSECARVPIDDSQAALVFCAPDWHRGVLGIVASRLVERFHRPVFVLSEDRDTGFAQGSGRSITRFHLLDALESMPEMFVKFGGHSHAAGLTLAASNVALFRRDLETYAALRLTPEDFAPEVPIDAVMTLRDISETTVTEISTLEPFGCGHPAPLFAALGAEVAGLPVIWKQKHLRVPLRQEGRLLWLKAWNFAERASELPQGALVDAAFSLEEDSYAAASGMPGWSAVLRDVRPAEMRI